jgi:cytoplasmic iron level regulating protein YaaA (DUF328/UPF0246 family)
MKIRASTVLNPFQLLPFYREEMRLKIEQPELYQQQLREKELKKAEELKNQILSLKSNDKNPNNQRLKLKVVNSLDASSQMLL